MGFDVSKHFSSSTDATNKVINVGYD